MKFARHYFPELKVCFNRDVTHLEIILLFIIALEYDYYYA